MKHILILAKPDDVHARAVQHFIQQRSSYQTAIIDTSEYPYSLRLNVEIDQGETKYIIHHNELAIHSQDVGAVWYRRFSFPIIRDVEAQKVRGFCFEEASTAIEGWLDALGDRLINPLNEQNSLDRKVTQLDLARKVGFNVPRTLITNDALSAKHFLKAHEEHGQEYIFKAFSGSDFQFVETRKYKSEYDDELANLKYAPAIFQEAIVDGEEIRTTVVGNRVFSVLIEPKHPGAKLDWRLDAAASVSPYQLSQKEEDLVLSFMKASGLSYGALDFKRSPDGTLWFFEINVGGQFLFSEIHGQHPISEMLAQLLIDRAQMPTSSGTLRNEARGIAALA